jgi:hypothetical protein
MMINIILYLGATLIAWLSVYIDSKLFDRKTKKSTYVKIILLSNLLVFLTTKFLFIVGSKGVVPSNVNKIIEGPTQYLPDIGEQMITGVANF